MEKNMTFIRKGASVWSASSKINSDHNTHAHSERSRDEEQKNGWSKTIDTRRLEWGMQSLFVLYFFF